MDCKQIEQILARYWRCETSLQEEELLRQFFNSEDIPAHLLRYKELFVYQTMQSEIGLDETFDQRLLDIVEAPVVNARRITLFSRFMPLLKAAAVVVFVVMIGNVIQYSLLEESTNEYNYDSFVDTYDTPEAAYQQVSSALWMISEGINKSKQPQLADSLGLEYPERMIE